MADEAPGPEPVPQPPPLPSPEARKARRAELRARFLARPAPKKGKVARIAGWTLAVTAASGMVLAIAIPGMLSSQGARYSVRIQWERRNAELDAAIGRARDEGKLPAEPARP